MLHLSARIHEQLDRLLDVVDAPVADRCRHPLAIDVQIETDLPVADTEPDVGGLVRVGRDTQQPAVQSLRLVQVRDRNDERVRLCPHAHLLPLAVIHRRGLVRHCFDGSRRKKVTVDGHEFLARRFEKHRAHLRAEPSRPEVTILYAAAA